METGTFDLKGLAEWGVNRALGTVPNLGYLSEHITPLVGMALTELGMPVAIEVGIAGTLLMKAVMAGLARQKEIDTRNAEARAAQAQQAKEV